MVTTFSKTRKLMSYPVVKGALIFIGCLSISTFANAAPGDTNITAGLCFLVTQYKLVLGIAAMIAILVAVLNSFFAKSALIADLVEKVVIGCGIAAAASYFVSSTGLAATC